MTRGRAGKDTGDDGVTLIVVLMTMVLVTGLLLTSLGYVMNGIRPARTTADSKAATAAAQAGIDDYVARLTADTNYWTNGGVDAGNPAFTTGTALASGARFTYRVVSPLASIQSTGVIKLLSTGTVPAPGGTGTGTAVSRSLFATLRVAGFLSYIYMSDFEVRDPDVLGTPSCADYYYASTTAGADRRAGSCSAYEIQWMASDTIQGPFHSNDALQINGAVNFTDAQTESSWPALYGVTSGKTWWGTQPAGSLPGNIPIYAPPIALPASNATLLNYVRPNMTGNAAITTGPGCYYSGPTEIVFQGASMLVRSPRTTSASTPADCYNPSLAASWQTISPIPQVIYVGAAGGSSCSGTNAGISYPLASETFTAGTPSDVAWTSGGSPGTINYSCSRGTVYLRGTANTSTTVASADDIVITGDLTVPSLTGSVAIGLIGGNMIWIYHPLLGTANYPGFTPATTIQAGMLALKHSIMVENYSAGVPLGTLNITGTLAQKYRGPVGTGTGTTIVTGYAKNYVYDTRLTTLQPPYFLQPTASPWHLTAVAAA